MEGLSSAAAADMGNTMNLDLDDGKNLIFSFSQACQTTETELYGSQISVLSILERVGQCDLFGREHKKCSTL